MRRPPNASFSHILTRAQEKRFKNRFSTPHHRRAGAAHLNYHLKRPPSFEPPHLKIALDFGSEFALAFESSLAILTSNPLQMSTSLSSPTSRFISDVDANFYLEFAFDLEGRNCTHWHVARAHSHARALARTRSPESAGHARIRTRALTRTRSHARIRTHAHSHSHAFRSTPATHIPPRPNR